MNSSGNGLCSDNPLSWQSPCASAQVVPQECPVLSRGYGVPCHSFSMSDKSHIGPDAHHMEKCHWCQRRGSLMRLFPWSFAREARWLGQGHGLRDMFPSPTPVRVGVFSFAMSSPASADPGKSRTTVGDLRALCGVCPGDSPLPPTECVSRLHSQHAALG